jgi:hypothetical protein
VDNQRLAVASLSGQQLRAAEVRAKLGGAGGYATPRSDKGNAAPFVLNIKFSGGRTTRIEGIPVHPEDFDAIPPAYQNSLPVAPAGDLPPPSADEDDGNFDEGV